MMHGPTNIGIYSHCKYLLLMFYVVKIMLGHVNMSDHLTTPTNEDRLFLIRLPFWSDVEPVC